MMIKQDSKVCIILMGSLGDVVRGLSILPPLKQFSDNIEITWIVDARWHSLLKDHPLIDRLIIFPRPFKLSDFKVFYQELKDSKYDFCLDLQRIFKSGFLSLLSSASARLAFHPANSKEYNYLFNNKFISECDESLAKIRHYHKFLELLKVPSAEPYKFALDYLKGSEENNQIALVLESSWSSKNWVPAGYQKLIELILKETSFEILLLGTKAIQDLAGNLEKLDARVENKVGQTTLPELAAVLSSVQVAVGPDSGPGHLAAALGTPYVSLFGPTPIDRVVPYQSEDLAVSSNIACRPCNRKVCPGLDKLCMRLIRVEEVWLKIQQVLNKTN